MEITKSWLEKELHQCDEWFRLRGHKRSADSLKYNRIFREMIRLALAELERREAEEGEVVNGWFSYSPMGDGFDFHSTAASARKAAEADLEVECGNACDGWHEEIESICWGRVHGAVEETLRRPATAEDQTHGQFDEYVEYELIDTIRRRAEAKGGEGDE